MSAQKSSHADVVAALPDADPAATQRKVTITPVRIHLFVLALVALRALFLLLYGNIGLGGDGKGYLAAAEYIASTHSLPPLQYQPKGYSLFLAGVLSVAGDNYLELLKVLHIAMDAIVVFMLCQIAIFFLKGAIGHLAIIIVCTILAVQPFTAAHYMVVYPDHTCQFLTFSGTFLLWYSIFYKTNTYFTISGAVLLGLAGIIRPDMLPVHLIILLTLGILGWMTNLQRHRHRMRLCCFALAGFIAVPTGYLSLQVLSTGELGFARSSASNNPALIYQGYSQWLRSWVIFDKSEHSVFAWGLGQPGWRGFDVQLYPERVFESPEERELVGQLLNEWAQKGYSGSIDQRFSEIASERCDENIISCRFIVPLARMAAYWINLDGAQVFIVPLELERPFSTIMVALVLIIRIAILSFALIGVLMCIGKIGEFAGGKTILILICAVGVFFRTMELGMLGMLNNGVSWGGLAETRYVASVFPLAIVLALGGLPRIKWRSGEFQGEVMGKSENMHSGRRHGKYE